MEVISLILYYYDKLRQIGMYLLFYTMSVAQTLVSDFEQSGL